MKRLVQIAAALLLSTAPAGAAVQIIDSNGTLTGATGVNVGGTLYDVSFLDGTCAAVFSGCDSAADFAFSDTATAQEAARSLLAQVFVGVFNTNPQLTRGCTDSTYCSVFIPFSVNTNSNTGVTAVNNASDQYGGVGSYSASVAYDSATIAQNTWGRFILSGDVTGAVPEPSTWAMMLMGFGAMGICLRSRRRVGNLLRAA